MHRVTGLIRRSPWLVGLPRDVVVLAAIAFCVALGFGIVLPAIPIFASDFGVTTLAVGAVVSVFALMRFVASPVAGVLANKLGERLVLAAGLVIVAVSSLLAGLADSYSQLLVMRGFGGIGSSMFTVSAMALLLRTTDRNQRGRAASAFQAGFLFGGVAGPAVGGLVVAVSIRAPFFVYAATLGLAAVVALTMLHPRPRAELVEQADQVVDPDSEPPIRVGAALRMRSYQAALLANLNNGLITFGIRAALIPVFVVEVLRQGAVWAGFGFLVAAIAQAVVLIPAGRITDHRGRRPGILAGAAATMTGMLLLALSTNLIWYLLGMAVLGAGAAFLGSAPAAVVGDIMGRHRGGAVVAGFQMVSDLGAVVGPLAAGWVADRFGYSQAFSIGVVSAAFLLLVAFRMRETRVSGP
ncbi:MAG: MFS transporter [Candidatus Nanopelagicales bacterium]|nr:MFS transporter [Candidatus Nanopelagicales bacterium]